MIFNDDGLERLVAAIVQRAFVDMLSPSVTLQNDAGRFLSDVFDFNRQQAQRKAVAVIELMTKRGADTDDHISDIAIPAALWTDVMQDMAAVAALNGKPRQAVLAI